MRYQQHDVDLINMAKSDSEYVLQGCLFVNDVRKLKHLVQWYHTFLCHLGETHTEQTIQQHFTWGGLN